jgi:hypothetical protein
LISVAVFSATGTAAQAQNRSFDPRIEAIEPITINEGFTEVPAFTPDGKTATIVKAWRDNGNAHGFWVTLVTLSGGGQSEPGRSLIGIERPSGAFDHEMVESPHTFEDWKNAILFARARIDGTPGIVLIEVARDFSKAQSLADRLPLDVTIYRVAPPDDATVGMTPYRFEIVTAVRLAETACDARAALALIVAPDSNEAKTIRKTGACPP